MTTLATRAASALLLAVALALPAIYAEAQTGPHSDGSTGRMMGRCGEMMNRGMMGNEMMGGGNMMNGRQADRGTENGMMGGGQRPNQQWQQH